MSVARFTLLLPALGLAACAAGPSGEAVGRLRATPAEEAGPALASLPPAAGRVVAVRRTAFADGFRQEIVLEGPRAMAGENRITVEALTTARAGRGGDENLRLGPPTDTEVAAAMDRELPGVPMRLAEAPADGAAGPVGYAFGSAGRLTCVYGWRFFAPERPLSLFEGVTDTGTLPMSVRVRLCREGPLAALVDALRGLRVARAGEASPAVPGGDPLDAALGAGVVAAFPTTDGGATPARPARFPLRPAAARAAAHRHPPSPRRAPAPAAARPAPAGESGRASLSAPRLPLPAEVAAAPEAAPRRASAPAVAPPAATGADPMPLPQ